MSSFIISDLQLFIRRRNLLPGVNGGAVRFKFYRYDLPNLASPDRFWTLSFGWREDGYPRNICPGCDVFDNGGLHGNVDKAVRFLVPRILVLVLLPMLHDYFNGCTDARSLDIVAQIKKREDLYWYLQV
jgi:hypothetical protein